ncbi:MAG TPA: NADPH-dependent glutamate synthase [Spirochaetia bacterium]|nr:NADPH-dependent glutamate synthase [Spirochaetia bacterium]
MSRETSEGRLLREILNREEPMKNRDRLQIPPQDMPQQDPQVRGRNIEEVALGYTEEQARLEALRCLQCKNAPCVEGCPVRIDIPGFVREIAQGSFREAAAIIKRNSLLPAVCGRVCPQEVQCQLHCTVGKSLKDVLKSVAVGRLERFVADRERESGDPAVPEVKPVTGKRVAVIGSGPAGLVAAADIRREGHEVVMFEAFHKPGGVMVYGIPEFRLPKRIVQKEIDTLIAMGVEVRCNFVVGKTRKLTALLEEDGFDAAFIGTGAGLPRFLRIEGENLVGVFSANEYLTRTNLMKAYDRGRADTPLYPSRRVAVLGGGNVAMDSARMALRLGAEEVTVVYRRTEVEMPARVEEVERAKEEGINFHLLENAKRILGDEKGRVRAMECLCYELGEPDDSGRRRPVPIQGSEFLMELDTVIVAIGNDSNPLIKQTTPEIETNRWGNIIADESGKTSLDRVYAGGDIVLGAATVILAMGQGRTAAESINRLLEGVLSES